MPRKNKLVEFFPGDLDKTECPNCQRAGYLRMRSHRSPSTGRVTPMHATIRRDDSHATCYYMKCEGCGDSCTGRYKVPEAKLRGDRPVVMAAGTASLTCPGCKAVGTTSKTSGNKTIDDFWRVRCDRCQMRYFWQVVVEADPRRKPAAPRAQFRRKPVLERMIDADEASLIRQWVRDADRQLGGTVAFSNAFEIYDMTAARRLERIGLVTFPDAGKFGVAVELTIARKLLAAYDGRRGKF